MESSSKYSLALGSAGFTTVLSAALTLAAPPEMSKIMNGPLPDAPEREKIQVVLGVDDTGGENSKKVADVRKALGALLDRGILEGDSVLLCKIGGQGRGAQCTEYIVEQPSERTHNAALESDLAELKGQRQYTLIYTGVQTMLEQSDTNLPRVGFVWSGDFIDGSQVKSKLALPFELNLIVADPKFAPNATHLCDTVTGDCTIFVAQNDVSVGNAIIRSVTPLKVKSVEKYRTEHAAYRAAQQAQADTTTRLMGAGGLLTTFFGFLTVKLLKQPQQITGFIVDVRPDSQHAGQTGIAINPNAIEIISLREAVGREVNLRSLRRNLPSEYLSATRKGVFLSDGTIVNSGDQVVPGVYYFAENNLPQDAELQRLRTDYGKSRT